MVLEHFSLVPFFCSHFVNYFVRVPCQELGAWGASFLFAQTFLYSVILTKYVAIERCVYVCMCVYGCVCDSAKAQTNGWILVKFSTNDLTDRPICEVQFSRILKFQNR